MITVILNTQKLSKIEPKHTAVQHFRTLLILQDTRLCKKNETKENIHKLN